MKGAVAAVAAAAVGGGLWVAAALAAAATATEDVAPPSEEAAPSEETVAVPRRDVGPIVDALFDKRFAFCHDPVYALTQDEMRWCDLIPKSGDKQSGDKQSGDKHSGQSRCPTLAQACARGPTATLVGRRRSIGFSVPEAPQSVRVLVWVLLAGGTVMVLRYLVRHAGGGRWTEPAMEAKGEPVAAVDTVAAARLVETDVERLLNRASVAAAAGDFRAAVEDAYAALLRKLEGAGVVRVEAHRTNGDHVREVGRKFPALRSRVESVVSSVERVQFGGEAPGAASFQAVREGVVGLVAERLSAWMLIGAGVGLLGALAGCDLDRGRWDESPSGRAAVLSLLDRYGFEARERLAPVSKVNQTIAQLVLLPGVVVGQDDWTALGAWVSGGGTLTIATTELTLPPWVGAMSVPTSALASSPLIFDARHAIPPPPVTAAVPPGREVRVRPPGDDDDGAPEIGEPLPLLRRGQHFYAIEHEYDEGRVVILADDHLFTNASLLVADNARVLTELLLPGGKKVELAGELTGLVSPNPLTSVGRGRLAPPLLQLAAVALLFFAFKGTRFGRPLDPATRGRRAFAEHARAVGLQYARGRASRYALEIYATYALERLRERLRLGGRRGIAGVAEAVAARTGRSLGDVMRVLVEARPHEGGNSPAASSAEDLVTLREVATLLASTGGSGERTRD